MNTDANDLRKMTPSPGGYTDACHPHPCLSVPIRGQVVKTRVNKGFLEKMDGHCQQKCQ
jgi:hypothetical protein